MIIFDAKNFSVQASEKRSAMIWYHNILLDNQLWSLSIQIEWCIGVYNDISALMTCVISHLVGGFCLKTTCLNAGEVHSRDLLLEPWLKLLHFLFLYCLMLLDMQMRYHVCLIYVTQIMKNDDWFIKIL